MGTLSTGRRARSGAVRASIWRHTMAWYSLASGTCIRSLRLFQYTSVVRMARAGVKICGKGGEMKQLCGLMQPRHS